MRVEILRLKSFAALVVSVMIATSAAGDPAVEETQAKVEAGAEAPKSLPPSIGDSKNQLKGEVAASDKPYDLISDGARIDIKDKGFSIIPPQGWEVIVNHPNLSLLMQVPFKREQRYQRTIQVAVFSGPRYMDDVTAKEYERVITQKFSQALASVQNYRIRNFLPVEMADGRGGILYYSEFSLENVSLMQAHILVSSRDYHYLLTYTDVAEHFEDERFKNFLSEAWTSMISVELSGSSPSRFEAPLLVGLIGLIFLVLAVSFWGFRTWKAGQDYKEYTQGGGKDDDFTTSRVQHSETTGDASNYSHVSEAKGSVLKSSGVSMHSRVSEVKESDFKSSAGDLSMHSHVSEVKGSVFKGSSMDVSMHSHISEVKESDFKSSSVVSIAEYNADDADVDAGDSRHEDDLAG